MIRHDRYSRDGPSAASVAVAGALVAASATGTGYVLSGVGFSVRELVAVSLGMGLTAVSASRLLHLAVDRAVIADRAREAADQGERQRDRDRRERACNTGVWTGPRGQSLSVRWDWVEGRYYVQGWLSESWQSAEETPWRDVETLAWTVGELERDGDMFPADGDGTRAVRAWLGLSVPEGVEPEVGEGEPVSVVVPAYTRSVPGFEPVEAPPAPQDVPDRFDDPTEVIARVDPNTGDETVVITRN